MIAFRNFINLFSRGAGGSSGPSAMPEDLRRTYRKVFIQASRLICKPNTKAAINGGEVLKNLINSQYIVFMDEEIMGHIFKLSDPLA